MPYGKLPYHVELRMRYIDIWLDHCGHLNRQPLMEFFGISESAATRDIKQYMKLAPNNTVYDKFAMRYIRGAKFKRVWT